MQKMKGVSCPRCGHADGQPEPDTDYMMCTRCGHRWLMTDAEFDAIIDQAIRDANERMN